jgi:osmotically-inducible protein OsmY
MKSLQLPQYSQSPRNARRIILWALLAALTPTLAGCFGAAVIGIGASALMIADRRPAETQLTDEGIEMRAANRITEKLADRVHVNVTSYNRSVLLTGEIPDNSARVEVEKLVSGVPNVKAISNELQVSGNSSLGARSNDSFITSKVKARFVDANKFAPHLVKVVTESGVVYLLGLVTKHEAEAAVEVARTTGGVLKVVRVFDIVTEEQSRQMDNQPGTTTASPPKK